MRLDCYLFEGTQNLGNPGADEINKILHKECKPYLHLIRGLKPIFRGLATDRGTAFGKKETRSDRKSSYFSKEHWLPEKINQFLANEGHLRRDKNVVIGTGSRSHARRFSNYTGGEVYYIFPIGNIRYSYIAAEDINLSDHKTGWGGADAMKTYLFDYDPKQHIEWVRRDGPSILSIEKQTMDRRFEDYFHTDEGIIYVIREGYEIWFKCKAYYFVNVEAFNWDMRAGTVVEL